MAESFWKSLGSTLVETGAAYLQQVRLVNELRQLSPEDARARFAQYVQGLSGAARAGFAVTLTALANNERSAEAKRFIESLRAALANPNAVTPLAAFDSSAPTSSPTRAQATFDEDLQRVAGWFEADEDARIAAITDHLNALDVEGLNTLREHLGQMQQNCATNIQNHRDNEARIVAGRFVEDQMSYNMAVLRTGQHDPNWVRQLNELEEWGRRFEALHGIVSLALERRAASAASEASPDEPDALTAVKAMRQLLEQQLESGEVRGERAVAFRRLLDKIGSVLVAAERKEIEPEQAVIRVKQLYADVAPMLANPGAATRTSAGSPRLRELDGYAGAIKTAIGRELMESPGTATMEAMGAILGDLAKFQQEVAGITDDDALVPLESSVLRVAARAHHELTVTRHALIARPVWESFDYLPAVNAVAYSGAADLQQQLEAALSPMQLTVQSSKRLQNRGQLRWDELNSCHVAVFDMRSAGEMATLVTTSPKRARELATAAYELGLAFALGKPVVVVAGGNDHLPFDIDLSPVTLDGDDDAAMLQQAIDEAFYVPQRRGGHTSIGESIAFLDNLTAGHEKRKVFEGMGWLGATLAEDPVGFAAATAQLLPMLGEPPWRLLRPAWPAAYPDPAEKRCFHVMPFGPEWANDVRDVARTFCQEHGFVYRRGDEAEDGRIMHAIWEDLCRAHVVLVDLTGANLNVMIELGMAHAIGRPLLAVRRSDAADVRPKNIEKLRVLRYESPADLMTLLQTRWPS